MRPLERADAPKVAQLAGDWEVARWTSDIPHPYDASMARDFIAWAQDELAGQRRFFFAMVARASGDLVGIISLTRNGPEEGEIGYWVGLPYQGQGFAREAAGVMIAMGFEALSLRRVVAACRPDNERSWRVMEHCGMRYVEDVQRWSMARRQTFRLSLYAIEQSVESEPR
ncbi:MAG: GNAT family N-acetyltransferase [Proteobacteria bacterium]|nr:GNAT family N-acetyltransferase [Pseudomonadota bacterium]